MRPTRASFATFFTLLPLVAVAACGGGELETTVGAQATAGAAGVGGGSAGSAGIAGAGGATAGAGGVSAGAGGAMAGAAGQAGSSGGGAGGAKAVCGDGVRAGVEQCDAADLGGATCASATGGVAPTGTLSCFANCTFDTLACVHGGAGAGGGGGAGGATTTCGNGKRDAGEPCDGADLGGATCQAILGDPAATGAVACFINCTLDAGFCVPGGVGGAGGGGAGGGGSVASVCGDGVKSGLEGCDGADLGAVTCASATGDASSTGAAACFANCTLDLTLCSTPPSSTGASCGDGVKDNLEQCDGADRGGASCATVLGPGATGAVACHTNCTLDASACVLGGAGGAGGAGAGGTAGGAGAGGGAACVVTSCLNHVYACGDCMDNDGDGLTDMEDPDCLGPCHNNEDKFALGIPGANNAPCKQDCYYDYDSGSGNDGCEWDHSCDPLEVAPDFYPEGAKCEYDPKTKVTPKLSCTQAAAGQPSACTSYCSPLTPNGCDCFGCCELPAAGGKFVWLGSTDGAGNGTCKLGDEGDPTKCHPCTPVPACLNTCEKCELCLGKTTLPAECSPPPQLCGDGKVEGSEQCDGASVPVTCAVITGNPSSTGAVACAPNCTLDGSACDVPTTKCGDGVRTGLEQCDGADVGVATCPSVTGDPTSAGAIACLPNCLLDGSGCSVPPPGSGGAGGAGQSSCGNGVREGGEQCDGGDVAGATCASVTGNPGATGVVKCFPNCTLDGSDCKTGGGPTPVCGNGVKEAGEQCDGNDVGAATCASTTGDPDSTGAVKCFPNCTFDTGGCSTPSGGGGSSACGAQQCPAGSQACNVAAGCPCQKSADFCLTGCCQPKP